MLKGQTVFELTDVKTGEVERIIEENMFTGALDNILNNAPFYLNASLLRNQLDSSVDRLTPIYKKALGGLLLFPNTNEEDATLFYAPHTNKPVGIASSDAYSGADSRRGSFNVLESGRVEGGYRYVWDFSTSQANGRIASVSLTSERGGEAYYDESTAFFHTQKYTNVAPVGIPFTDSSRTYYGPNDESSQYSMLGCDSGALYIRQGSNLRREKMPRHIADLFFTEEKESVETIIEDYPDGALCLADSEIWIVRTNGNTSGNATINIDKYNKDTLEHRTESITVTAQLYRTSRTMTCALRNGYLYMRGQGAKVVEINLGNLADVTEIDVPAGSERLNTFGHLIAGVGFLIEEDRTVHANSMSDGVPMYLDGCWAILGTVINNNYGGVFASGTILTPYLGTINNLKNPVTKTPDKTLKVTYTVTQV